jgi:CubicO group peptidase (beta-lactamase class C family)
VVATVIIERFSLEPFEAFVTSRIFDPLNMNSTTYSPEVAQSTGMHSHTFDPDGRRVPNLFTEDDYQLIAGAGGVISSTVDMVKWVRLLLGHATQDAKKAVPASILEECMKPQAALLHLAPGSIPLPLGGTMTYGLGWHQLQYNQHQVRGRESPLLSALMCVAIGGSAWRQRSRHQLIGRAATL